MGASSEADSDAELSLVSRRCRRRVHPMGQTL